MATTWVTMNRTKMGARTLTDSRTPRRFRTTTTPRMTNSPATLSHPHASGGAEAGAGQESAERDVVKDLRIADVARGSDDGPGNALDIGLMGWLRLRLGQTSGL